MDDLKQAAALVEAAENEAALPPEQPVPEPAEETPEALASEELNKDGGESTPSAAAPVYAPPLLAGSHDDLGEVLESPPTEEEEDREEEGTEAEEEAALEVPEMPEVEEPEEEEAAEEEAAPPQMPPPLNGVYETVDEDGRRSVLTYKDGELTGPIQVFDPNGLILIEAELDHGELCGLCKTYENGILRSETGMEKGVPHGVAKLFDERGELFSETTFVHGLKQGEMIQYDDQGEVGLQATYVDDALNGPFKTFTQGALALQTTYKDGQIHGIMENFYTGVNGSGCLRTATYDHGILQGEERIYHTSGSLLMQTEYADGKAIGKPIVHQPPLPK